MSTTPQGSPPGHLQKVAPVAPSQPVPVAPVAPVADTASILQVLANIANQNTSTPAQQPPTPVSVPFPVPAAPANSAPLNPPTGPSARTTIPGFSNIDVAQVANLIQQTQNATPASVAGQPWNIPQSSGSTDANQRPDNQNFGSNKRSWDRRDSRSRSPEGRSQRNRNRSRSPSRRQNPAHREIHNDYHPPRTRTVTHDPSLPPGTVKVFSRTLFIGGVPPFMTEGQLTEIFKPYGEVQSMIFHKEKRHAFVKVYSRAEAEIAREKFEEGNKTGNLTLRARWGVGFGPRDCCDYQTGISVIPLSKLTDADKRWMVEAEYGGTGGLPLDAGLCVEEPDIEIGAGVSSKAISSRMPTNGSRNGPRSSRPEREHRNENRERDNRRWNSQDRRDNNRNDRYSRERFENRNAGGNNFNNQKNPNGNYGGNNFNRRDNSRNWKNNNNHNSGNNSHPNDYNPQGHNFNNYPGNNGYNMNHGGMPPQQPQQMQQYPGSGNNNAIPANLVSLLSNLTAVQQNQPPQQPGSQMYGQDPNMAGNLMAMLSSMGNQQQHPQQQQQQPYGLNSQATAFYKNQQQHHQQPPR